MRRAALGLLAAALALGAGPEFSSRADASTNSATPRLLFHAVQATSKAAPCTPSLGSCAGAITQGFVGDGDLFYHVYLVVASYDTAGGVHEIEVGLSYDTTTHSGVDIFEWSLCADGQVPGPDWWQAGGDNQITWNSKNADSLSVAGYFYTTAYDPGLLALVPASGGEATLTPFSGPPVTIPGTALGYIGFGSSAGCNPCLASCAYTAVRPSTWSSIKSFFNSP
jgi:hypothetical protein